MAHDELVETEIDRLNALIDATAQHWLNLQQKHPIPWEGAIDAAMAAACDTIEQQAARIARLREALELADAALRGANMDMSVVERKVVAALGGGDEQYP